MKKLILLKTKWQIGVTSQHLELLACFKMIKAVIILCLYSLLFIAILRVSFVYHKQRDDGYHASNIS